MEKDPRKIISEMCQNFYQQGWVSGTGGGISIRRDDRIYMAPSGVEKEKIRPQDCFVINMTGDILEGPENEKLKLTECAPLFLSAFELRNAGAVLHSHSSNVVLMTMLAQRIDEELSVLEFTQLEMIKGIIGHGYYDTFELPVVDNTARECDLTASMRKAMERFPNSPAVAVRNHGIYVWGPDEVKAKTQAECIDFICEVYWKMRSAGIESHISAPPQTAALRS